MAAAVVAVQGPQQRVQLSGTMQFSSLTPEALLVNAGPGRLYRARLWVQRDIAQGPTSINQIYIKAKNL